jgi:hypothetical protein
MLLKNQAGRAGFLDAATNAREHRSLASGVKPGRRGTATSMAIFPMKELLRSNDAVRLSYVQAMLRGAGIDSVLLDQHTSIIEGSIGAIQRRIMVEDDDLDRARALLAESGEAPP